MEQASKRAEAAHAQHQQVSIWVARIEHAQVSAEVQVVSQQRIVAQTNAAAASEQRDHLQKELDDASSELWQVKKLKLDAQLLNKKVLLTKRQLRAAESQRGTLQQELARLQVLKDSSAVSRAEADRTLSRNEKEDELAERAVEKARKAISEGMTKYKELELQAEQLSSEEVQRITQLEDAAREMKTHRLSRFEHNKDQLRDGLKRAQSDALHKQSALQIAQQVCMLSQRLLTVHCRRQQRQDYKPRLQRRSYFRPSTTR